MRDQKTKNKVFPHIIVFTPCIIFGYILIISWIQRGSKQDTKGYNYILLKKIKDTCPKRSAK